MSYLCLISLSSHLICGYHSPHPVHLSHPAIRGKAIVRIVPTRHAMKLAGLLAARTRILVLKNAPSVKLNKRPRPYFFVPDFYVGKLRTIAHFGFLSRIPPYNYVIMSPHCTILARSIGLILQKASLLHICSSYAELRGD